MITLSDGQRVQCFDEGEVVRRRVLEEQGWRVVADDSEPPAEVSKSPPTDMETQILDGMDALAPEAVDAARERKRGKKSDEGAGLEADGLTLSQTRPR